MSFTLPEPPTRSGAYRWFYVDLAAGEWTAVFIFMIGSIFSPRYARAQHRGGLPLEHAAVNAALYRRGRRQLWLLHEYPSASLSERALQIGRSRFTYEGECVGVELSEPGQRVALGAKLWPESPPLGEVRLSEAEAHFWEPRIPRARAELRVDDQTFEGFGYHDTNHGDGRLGRKLRRWRWTRAHGPQATRIDYRVEGGASLAAEVGPESAAWLPATHPTIEVSKEHRTGWGLTVPSSLGNARRPRLLESSPFYARLEASGAGDHVMSEVADFGRFHSPWVRWMAHFRTRRMVVDTQAP